MKSPEKYAPNDISFFATLDWVKEAQNDDRIDLNYARVCDLIKIILLDNSYKLNYDNIELAKHYFVLFCLERKLHCFYRTPNDFSVDERKYIPIVKGNGLVYVILKLKKQEFD